MNFSDLTLDRQKALGPGWCSVQGVGWGAGDGDVHNGGRTQTACCMILLGMAPPESEEVAFKCLRDGGHRGRGPRAHFSVMCRPV